MIETLVLVGIGGAAGSMLRYRLSKLQPVRGVPSGTLTVNVTGSFAIGVLAGLGISGKAYNLLCVGLLGGYTTFSSFGFETFRLLENGDYGAALVNIASNVLGSLLGVYLGWTLIGFL